MYGYVTPKKDCLKMQDFVLYRAFYCGICKATGSLYGQLPRLTTNYDMVFLSVLLHDCTAQEVQFQNGGCVLNPFKKKASVCRNQLLDRLVATNIILSYYKVADDIIDREGGGKRLVSSLMLPAYKKAVRVLPQVDEIIRGHYTELRRLECQNTTSIDRVSHCFSQMLMEIAKQLLGEGASEDILKLCYNVGKFVYLADALDDICEDYKKKRYNPFLASYGGYKSRRQFLADNAESISYTLTATVNRVIECFNNARFTQSYDLLQNIVYYGLRHKVDELIKSPKKLPKPKI